MVTKVVTMVTIMVAMEMEPVAMECMTVSSHSGGQSCWSKITTLLRIKLRSLYPLFIEQLDSSFKLKWHANPSHMTVVRPQWFLKEIGSASGVYLRVTCALIISCNASRKLEIMFLWRSKVGCYALRDRHTDGRTLFSISEISKPCYFVLLARARAKDQSSGCLRQPLGREKMNTCDLYSWVRYSRKRRSSNIVPREARMVSSETTCDTASWTYYYIKIR